MNDYKAEDLIKLIRERYPMNRAAGYQSHVVLEQVADGTGMYQGRWIDAVVFSLWASKGLYRFAFEVKVSRSDFLHELSNPIKHKWCLECFHQFWFVAPQDVIQIEELPPNVGWMYPRGGKLAVKRHAVANPNPRLDDVLLAAFMRAASKGIDKANKITSKEVLESSEEYRRAKVYQDAIVQFINQRGNTSWLEPTNPEAVIEWLDDATMDKQLKQDRDHLLEVTGHFQREILNLLNLFLVVANKSLLARDELGKYVVATYGGQDDLSLDTLQSYINSAKAFDSQKKNAQLIKLLMEWGKE